MKKALVVISLGTTYLQAQKAILSIENTLAQAHPDCDFYRAFTSTMVIKKLKERDGVHVDTPAQLLERLAAQGYEEVLCQSLHVINGIEFEKMHRELAAYADRFAVVKLGLPLLTSKEDYLCCGRIVMEELPALKGKEALVFMGHGTDHTANAAYCQLENSLRFLGYENVYVGTVEGFPDLEYILARIKAKGISKVYLTPFMIVAGDHAQNDLAGGEEDSWKSILEAQGYETQAILKGLGEYAKIAQLFLAHLEEAQPL